MNTIVNKNYLMTCAFCQINYILYDNYITLLSHSSLLLHLSLFCLTSVLHQYAVTVLSDMILLNPVNLFRCHHTLLSICPCFPVLPLSMGLKSSCYILFSCSTDINLLFYVWGHRDVMRQMMFK